MNGSMNRRPRVQEVAVERLDPLAFETDERGPPAAVLEVDGGLLAMWLSHAGLDEESQAWILANDVRRRPR